MGMLSEPASSHFFRHSHTADGSAKWSNAFRKQFGNKNQEIFKKIFILGIAPKEVIINSEGEKKALHTTMFFTAVFITWTTGDDLNIHGRKNG